ncbi:hypothetical protein BC940DRAFT_343473 [Gongronella butleri]|nr:hypothetical protein BC940DRAFT_343473 [Gongronella butleri]
MTPVPVPEAQETLTESNQQPLQSSGTSGDNTARASTRNTTVLKVRPGPGNTARRAQGTIISTEKQEQVKKLFHEGLSKKRIGFLLNLSANDVSAVISKDKAPARDKTTSPPAKKDKSPRRRALSASVRRALSSSHGIVSKKQDKNKVIKSKKNRLSEAEKEEVKKLLLEGVTIATIAERFNVHETTVYNMRYIYSIPPKTSYRHISRAIDEEIEQLLESGKSVAEIVLATGVSTKSVNVRKLRLKSGQPSSAYKSQYLDPAKVAKVKHLVLKGATNDEVKRATNFSLSTIWRIKKSIAPALEQKRKDIQDQIKCSLECGKTTAETAAALGLKPNTVRQIARKHGLRASRPLNDQESRSPKEHRTDKYNKMQDLLRTGVRPYKFDKNDSNTLRTVDKVQKNIKALPPRRSAIAKPKLATQQTNSARQSKNPGIRRTSNTQVDLNQPKPTSISGEIPFVVLI